MKGLIDWSETHQQNETPLANVAKCVLRYDVSVRAAAAIVNGALIDHGIVTPDDQSMIVDMNKMQREINKCLEEFE
jgi:hypothetical protein